MKIKVLKLNTLYVGLVVICFVCGLYGRLEAQNVQKWRRHVISMATSAFSRNPFEIEVDAKFTHSDGTTLVIPGYYAGNNQWKIGFMPTKTGDWTYTTISSNVNLNNIKGSLTCVDSNLPGILKADPSHPKKWKFTDGSYHIPMAFRFDLFNETGTESRFIEVADFLRYNNATMLEFRLTIEKLESGDTTYFPIFEGDWQNHKFNLPLWDRLENRLEILRDRGLGVQLMLYSDDAGTPAWGAQSDTEKLLIRYVVARLCGYPVLLYNTGIDIAEYRNSSWINWFGNQIRSLDPYGHPVSSRHGGGSGSNLMAGQTFDSIGDRQAYIGNMINYYNNSSIPISMDDAWHENGPSMYDYKNFTEEDIRRAAWKCLIAGGLGILVRGSNYYHNDAYFRMSDFESDLQSEQWLKLVNTYLTTNIGAIYGEMAPNPDIISNAYCISNSNNETIVIYYIGKNDRWDPESSSSFEIDLSNMKNTYHATWYDTRNGNEISLGAIDGGKKVVINPPTTDDWILKMTNQTIHPDPQPGNIPESPSNLRFVY
jgi:hypothetical protein